MLNKKNREIDSKLNRKAWVFVIPATILIIAFVFYPMIQAFIISLQTGVGNNLNWAGFSNYQRLLKDTTFRNALFNTSIYLVIQVPIMIILALILSTMLNDKKLKFKGIFRTAIFLPCVTSLVAYSIIFKSLFATDGIINAILISLRIISDPISWITHPIWAKVLIIIAITWRWTGYNMVFYLSGLQGIDDSIYEAADIDGAGPIVKFKSITLPLLKPIILFTTINSTIGTLQLFDESMNITRGGPGGSGTITISHYIYNLMFKHSTGSFGYAAAVSYVIVVLVVILSFIQMKVGDKNG